MAPGKPVNDKQEIISPPGVEEPGFIPALTPPTKPSKPVRITGTAARRPQPRTRQANERDYIVRHSMRNHGNISARRFSSLDSRRVRITKTTSRDAALPGSCVL